MKGTILLLLVLLSSILEAQINELPKGEYIWTHQDSIAEARLILHENGSFELTEKYFFSCSPQIYLYGIGQYQLEQDSIMMMFDSIPHKKSEAFIDTLENDNSFTNIKITILDNTSKELEGASIKWGKLKKRLGRSKVKFFDMQVDEHVELEFESIEKVSFIRVVKEGFYPCEIPIFKNPKNDYAVKVILHPKPKIKSSHYISNTTGKLRILSGCKIQFIDEMILIKKDCP